jgi:hypothetical protein
MQTNVALWTLKEYLAEKLLIDPLVIKLEKLGIHSREFKDSDNGKTLQELEIQDGDKFSISAKMAMTLLDHLNLTFSDHKLTPEADRLFTEVFSTFTNEAGVMTRQTCTEFLKFCTNQNTDENDPRVKRLFDNYDKGNKNLITSEEFKLFYEDAINKKESTVWANIRSWNYKVDLKQGQNRDKRDPATLLRHLVPQKREYFDYLFGLLKEDYLIGNYSFELVSRLEVDPILFEKIVKLEDYDENGNQIEFKFENVIDTTNPFQLLYLFRIIRWISEYKNVTKAHVDVIFNEDEDKAEILSSMVVTGTSVTNYNVPIPTPAVPVTGTVSEINKNLKFKQSQSSIGKATNIVSAPISSGINVPPPPPLPFNLPDVPKQPTFNDSQAKEFEVKIYPPGGKQVDSDGNEEENIDTNSKSQDKEYYPNYKDEMKLPEFYLFEKYEEEMNTWVQRFIDKGGFNFLCKLYMSEDSIISQKLKDIATLSDEEKECSNEIVVLIVYYVTL